MVALVNRVADGSTVSLLQLLTTQAEQAARLVVSLWGFLLLNLILLASLMNWVGLPWRAIPGLWQGSLTDPRDLALRLCSAPGLAAILGALVLLQGVSNIVAVTLMVLLMDGLEAWMLPPLQWRTADSRGLSFAYLGFLVVRGYFVPTITATLLTVLVGCMGSVLMWDMLPSPKQPLWNRCLLSFLGGALVAGGLRSGPGF